MLQDYVVKVVLTCWSRLAPRLYRRFAPHVLLLGADMLIAGTLAGCWYLLSKACLAPRLRCGIHGLSLGSICRRLGC